MKFTDRLKWKRILLAVICLIGLLVAVTGSFAAYTSQAFQRGVARNRDNEAVRFTSNYLQNCTLDTQETGYIGRTVLFSEEQKTANELKVDIKIYNYVNGNTNLVSQRDITYNLEIKLNNIKDGNSYTVKCGNEAVQNSGDDTYKFENKTLPGRKANSHTYTVTFSGSDLDSLKITAVATPTSSSATNGQKLAAVIAPGVGSTTQTFRAEGRFVDDTSAEPTKYNGFNYEISISSGKANATLEWETDTLEIDRYFLKKLWKTEAEIKKILESGTVTFEMDQTRGTGDYLIPFYIRDKSNIPADWNTMNDKISFTAKQITQ